MLATVLLVLAGLALTARVAVNAYDDAQDRNRARFGEDASAIATVLGDEMQAQLAFTVSVRAFVAMEPDVGQTRFAQWSRELRAGSAFSGDHTVGIVRQVPRARLDAFLRRSLADPAYRKEAAGRRTIYPPGRRAVYCPLQASVASGAGVGSSLFDYCAPSRPGIPQTVHSLLRRAADSGQSVFGREPQTGALSVAVPIYRVGRKLSSVALRRAALIGWVGSFIGVDAMVTRAVRQYPSAAATVLYREASGQLVAYGRGGRVPAHAMTTSLPLVGANGWRAVVRGTPTAPVSPRNDALAVVGVGLLVTALGALLFTSLWRSRRRALALVEQKTQQLRYQALHDPLTNLPNRALAMDRAASMLARARRSGTACTAMFVDIDEFKAVNDRYGHDAGDSLLCALAARLQEIVRASDTVARLGGDEFLVLLEASDQPELVAERILSAARAPVTIDAASGQQIESSLSIGIATGGYTAVTDLLRDADVALYRAKAEGRGRAVTSDKRMRDVEAARRGLRADLARAIDRGELQLAYQPIFDLRSQTAVGLEALVRWDHPRRGILPPAELLPVAESTKLLRPIGRWVLNTACRRAAAWRAAGHDLGVTVNLAPAHLNDPAVVDDVAHALQDARLAPEALTLDISTAAFSGGVPHARERLEQLKHLGVRIAIDDFGTGDPEMAQLVELPVDEVKIDPTFVDRVARSEGGRTLVDGIIAVARELGIVTLAEGIEDADQATVLRDDHCERGQGFLFAEPLDADAVDEFLAGARAGDAR